MQLAGFKVDIVPKYNYCNYVISERFVKHSDTASYRRAGIGTRKAFVVWELFRYF